MHLLSEEEYLTDLVNKNDFVNVSESTEFGLRETILKKSLALILENAFFVLTSVTKKMATSLTYSQSHFCL